MRIGSVRALALRPARAAGPVGISAAHAIAGLGLAGDIHADALSPRQLLLASCDVYDELALPAHALGENLLLDFDTSSLGSGTVLAVGAEARLRLMFQCEACGRLDRFQPGLAGSIGARRGMLARVERGGSITPGDAVTRLGTVLPAWSEDWRARVQRVLDAVPPGCVLEYRLLARLAGIESTYCRAFPRVLAKLGPLYTERAVPAQSGSTRPRWDGVGLFDFA